MKSAFHGMGGARAGAGKPPFLPTDTDRSMVSVMAAVGVPHENIASIIGPNSPWRNPRKFGDSSCDPLNGGIADSAVHRSENAP